MFIFKKKNLTKEGRAHKDPAPLPLCLLRKNKVLAGEFQLDRTLDFHIEFTKAV